MTPSRSYTFATRSDSRLKISDITVSDNQASKSAVKSNSKASFRWRTAWVIILLLGVALRLQRLSWQPLWWDEGYSVYFATESLSTMLRLTALDIHPPLYYLLLHFWFNLVGHTGPESARLLSVLIGVLSLPTMTWASLNLWPQQRKAALLATLLLAISPIHIYYSQEVRMYGLALLLTLSATTFLGRIQHSLAQDIKPVAATIGYVLVASLALLTLYYTGFILLAHQLWALTINRGHGRRQLWYLVAASLILLIQLPWWLYAFPKLFVYIADKVLADQDISLPIGTYLWRHWLAFLTGHLTATQPWLETLRQGSAALIALLLATFLILAKWRDQTWSVRWLFTLLLIPTGVAFTVNLAYPFFPDGGERLLLQILPYLLLLLAFGSIRRADTRTCLATTVIAGAVIAGTFIAAVIGNGIYFTTPRYKAHDYRPIIADIVRQSRSNDTVLALFPWQVGYWRAYSPRMSDGAWLPPQPRPVEQDVMKWDASFASSLDSALEQGAIWFPMPLSFGSTLPKEIEDYLAIHARNLENHWYSTATRLTAWVKVNETVATSPLALAYPDGLNLANAGIAPTTVPSANKSVAVDLCWQPPRARPDLRATLRLLDASGFLWAKRDLTPLADHVGLDRDNPCLESIAFNIPVGLPPATYQLAIGVGPEDSSQLFIPDASPSSLIPIGEVDVTSPTEVLAPQHLPIKYWLSSPISDTGLLMLGYSGPGPDDDLLAGDSVDLSLFLQNTTSSPPLRELYVSILDGRGNGIAGWQGWPFPQYRTNTWASGALVQIPVQVYLPADIDAGKYTLVAGFIEPQTDNKPTPSNLNHVTISRRPTTYARPTTQFQFIPSPTFGTHATLIGYHVAQTANTLQLDLSWEILQPLLPAHHIFVHLLDESGQQIAQTDGEPQTSTERAPTGSWLPGEFLVTHHSLQIPTDASPPFTIQVGLYLPATWERLPVTIAGAIVGDNAEIMLPGE